MLTLKEGDPNSAIVPELSPEPGELVVRKTAPFGVLCDVVGTVAHPARRADARRRGCGNKRLRARERRRRPCRSDSDR